MTKKLVLVVSLFILTTGVFSDEKKKLYVAKVTTEAGIPDSIKKVIVDRIKLTVLEKYSKDYYVVSDGDVLLMYKKAAELQKTCDAEACIRQIAEAIDADEIIYGNAMKQGDKIRIVLNNLSRDKKTLRMGTKSVSDETFFETEFEHYIAEMTKKAIDPSYKINRSVEAGYDKKIVIPAFNMGKVKGLDLDVLQFKTEDKAIANILDYMKELIRKGDDAFNSKRYEDAIKEYSAVIKRIQEKIIPEDRPKVKSFEASVDQRITTSYVMQYKKEVEKIDKQVMEISNSKTGSGD